LHQVGDLFELNVKLRCQKVKRSAPLWVIAHRLVVISYRHFGSTSVPQHRYEITTVRCVMTQKNAVLTYSAAGALFQAVNLYS